MEKVHLKQQQKINNMMKTQNTSTHNNSTQYARVVNHTSTQFTANEIQLLNKGLKYNLHHKNKKWIETLALEAETAINSLDIKEQNYYRYAVAKKIKEINNANTIHNTKYKEEWKTIRNIQDKIRNNKLTITKADKGKTLSILTEEEYKQKVKNFIHNNQFTRINKDPTQQYQKIIKQTLRQCNNIIQKEHTWKYTNMNPSAPNLHATIKLHKHNTPIRPIINWINAPAYKLAKYLTTTLHKHLQLPYTYNVENTISLITDLQTIEINENTRLCSFDIENMYTNIPKSNLINVINNVLHNNQEVEDIIQTEIINILKTITDQNYFQFDLEHYKQCDGLAMGAPTSAILAETYIQNMEHTQIFQILKAQKIIAYFRYVDDILIIYDNNNTDINQTLNDFNNLQPTIKFTIEKEKNESINFLDLTIHRNKKQLQYSIYRKPTYTDIIIPKSSCHPHEHKMSGINYLINRLQTYPITDEAKDIERNTIKCILHNNEYDTKLMDKLSTQKKQKQNLHTDTQNRKTKWATFTYNGRETRKITKLFRDTTLKIAFRTKNTIHNILKPQPQIDKYNKSGIYQMKCKDCPMKYIGQTGRTFNTRYKEHIYDIKSNSNNTGYSKHILDTRHSYGPMVDTMDVIRINNKGKYLNTLEKYYIYKISRKGLHMNDMNINEHNPLFEVLHGIYDTPHSTYPSHTIQL
jgi:hypothetical protein